MKVKKNYLMEAAAAFRRDMGIAVDEDFNIYTDKVRHIARFTPMGMFLVDGEWRNDLLPNLLSGVYEIEPAYEHSSLPAGTLIRGFELIAGREGRIPERATRNSAGYDFFAEKDVTIPPHKTAVVWTGVKAYMQPNEVLKVYNRSSNASKKGLMLANGVGIVDADYYNNPDNEGDIGFCFLNITDDAVLIRKGDKLGQAIFETYAVADNDIAGGDRIGGFGSTGK